MTFVAPNLAWGEARGGSIPRQWGCDRRATKPQAKFGATLRAAVLFGPGGVARSLQIHGRDMRVARALPGPKTPRRKRHRIYDLDHLVASAAAASPNKALKNPLLCPLKSPDWVNPVAAAIAPPLAMEVGRITARSGRLELMNLQGLASWWLSSFRVFRLT